MSLLPFLPIQCLFLKLGYFKLQKYLTRRANMAAHCIWVQKLSSVSRTRAFGLQFQIEVRLISCCISNVKFITLCHITHRYILYSVLYLHLLKLNTAPFLLLLNRHVSVGNVSRITGFISQKSQGLFICHYANTFSGHYSPAYPVCSGYKAVEA